MKKIIKIKHIMAILLIFLMSSIVSAEIIEGEPAAGQMTNWPLGVRNVILNNNIEGVMYDFEEGSNCGTFRNQHPDVATFLTVLGTRPYGSDIPSYSRINGSMCGASRCYMNLWPYDNKQDWIFVVNGRAGFNPITGPDVMGGYWPGTEAQIEFKEDTTYVSGLISTGGTVYTTFYDSKGNVIHTKKIERTISRIYPEPSNFTQFFLYSPNTNIMSMKISGSFNAWHLDDFIVGGELGYIVGNYSSAAERMKLLVGAQYLKHGTGYDLYTGKYYTADEIKTIPLPYIDLDIKPYDVDWDIGIDNPGAILWAFNQESNVVKWYDLNDQMKHDFTEHVDYENIQPGNVGFIDYPVWNEETKQYDVGDGLIDEAFIIVEPIIDESGMVFDCIRIIPEAGVHYSNTEHINSLYNTETSFVDYRRLKDNPKGGHKPYKTIPTNKI